MTGKIIIFSVVALYLLVNVEAQRRPCDCFTTEQYEPVCGSNRVTYSNPGKLGCFNRCNNQNVTIAYRGRCEDRQPPCACATTLEYEPVCGSNRMTFGNTGQLNCYNRCNMQRVTIAYRGRCEDRPPRQAPVVPPPSCDCFTTEEYDPVCGSNRMTYGNAGKLGCFNQCNNQNITIAYRGRCGEIPSRPCNCTNTREYEPVCASNGRTFNNRGELRCYNQCNMQNLALAYIGQCRSW